MSNFKTAKWVMLLGAAATLVGCGGGGGGDDAAGGGAGGGGGGTTTPTTNQSPVANAGADQTVATGASVSLSGSGSTDSDGTIASYAWTQTAGPSVTLSGVSASTATFTAPSVTTATTFTFRLSVTDNQGATSTDTISVTVNAATSVATCPTPPSGIPTTSQATTIATLYNYELVNFKSPNGRRPEDALVEGADGNFYGVSRYGGVNSQGFEGDGLVYRLTRDGAITRLHTFQFSGTNALEGINPVGGLTLGTDCYLYGTTHGGYNAGGGGTVFKMTHGGTVTYLAGFNGTNGRFPLEKLEQGADGNFYGTTISGGAYLNQISDYLTGTIFKITPSGTLTTLVSFNGTGGGTPVGKLAEGSDGNFYGVTQKGGANGEGTIYKITPSGQFTLLWSFVGASGKTPEGGLVEANDGYLYGAVRTGGQYNSGGVYKISKSGQYTLVHSFNPVTVNLGCNCGPANPYAGLVLANDGNLYGTTSTGMSASNSGEGGAVFRVSPQGVVTPIGYFKATGPQQNVAELIQGRDGHLYGAAYSGGTNSVGAFFRVLLPGT